MSELFAAGRIVDLILVLVLGEAVALAVYHSMTGRGLELIDILVVLIPGACLLLALRAALTGAHWTSIAIWLGAALITHLADLWRRQRGV
jgi:hypothetical protein